MQTICSIIKFREKYFVRKNLIKILSNSFIKVEDYRRMKSLKNMIINLKLFLKI